MLAKKILSSIVIGSAIILAEPMVNSTSSIMIPIANATMYEQYDIDDSSLWYDKANSMFGAAVTNTDNGVSFTTVYRLDKINSNITYVMQSKNDAPFVQIGTIDWSRMASKDIGKPETGGKLFRRIADLAAQNAGFRKMF